MYTKETSDSQFCSKPYQVCWVPKETCCLPDAEYLVLEATGAMCIIESIQNYLLKDLVLLI